MLYTFFEVGDEKWCYYAGNNCLYQLSNHFADITIDDEHLFEMIKRKFGRDNVKSLRFRATQEEYLYELDNCMSHITLEVTQDCSMRCDYCVYSGHYANERKHTNLAMEIDTAKKALYFFSKHSKKAEDLVISFYGGEALLNFKLIQTIVSEGNQIFKGRNIVYRIATNGTTITDQVCKWLDHNKNVYLDITLNGDVHDKYRKLKNGQGSLEIIECNLRHLYEFYPNIAKHQICYICNYANYEELLLIKDYYDRNNICPTLITGIARSGGDNSIQRLGSDCSQEEYAYMRLKEEYIYIQSPFTRAIFEPDMRRIHNRRSDILKVQADIDHCCFPFMTNCFVDAKGNLTLCEKMPGLHRIGDIYEGIDYRKLSELMQQYLKIRNEHCLSCWAQRLCTVCYVDTENLTDFENACIENKKYIKECLELYCYLNKKRPDIIKCLN